ncbi:hypothetical protein ISG33_12610 [Glaciecola sp. MH2013]|nr:hypothetical protein [Glaciecola sp. MH2013]
MSKTAQSLNHNIVPAYKQIQHYLLNINIIDYKFSAKPRKTSAEITSPQLSSVSIYCAIDSAIVSRSIWKKQD